MSVSDTVCTCGATPERDSFGNALPCMRCYFGANDQRPADRIAQLTAELAEARQKYETNETALNSRISKLQSDAYEREQNVGSFPANVRRLIDERDTAVAEAATMREAILYAQRCTHPWYDPDGKMQKAISGDAGRALAERVRLWRELEALVRGAGCCDGDDAHWSDAGKDVLERLAALDAKGMTDV